MTTSPSSSARSPLYALWWALFLTLASLALFGLQTLGPAMYWWHAAVGEFMSTWQAIPDRQLFLFTADPDRPWVYDSWLSSVVLAALDDIGGAALALLIRNLLAAISVGLIAYFAARRHGHHLAVLTPVALAAGLLFLFVGVEPGALTVLAVTVAAIAAFYLFENPQRPWVALWLPLAGFATVNLDFATGLTVAFIGVITAAGIARIGSDEAGPKTVVSTVIAATSILAPLGFAYGPSYWPQAVEIAYSTPDTWLSAPVIIVVILIALSAYITADQPNDADSMPTLHRLILLIGTGASAIFAPSTIAVFAVFAALSIADPIAAKLIDGKQRDGDIDLSTPRRVAIGLAFVGVASFAIVIQPGVDTRPAVLTAIHGDVRTEAPLPGTMDADLPLRCLEDLREVSGQLRLFHDPDQAGFILYHLLDPQQARPLNFDDHRGLIDDNLRIRADVLRDEPAARGLFEDWDIDAAVVDRRQYTNVAEELDEAPGWHDLRGHRDEPFGCFVTVD